MSDPGAAAASVSGTLLQGGGDTGIALTEVAVGAAWNVQGDATHATFVAEVLRLFDIEVPRVPNTTARRAELTAYWLGPESWLLVSPSPLLPVEFVAARDAINAVGGALFDVSASRVAFNLQGPRAADLLAAGCPLDFDDVAFPCGACQQSVLFRVAALIEKHVDVLGYTVFVARSMAGGVSKALASAAAEYGYRVATAPPSSHGPRDR